MKLSNGIVMAEWSHSGRFRAWFEDNNKKPKFMRREYSGRKLREGSDFDFVHQGNWVGRVQREIRKYSGIRI